jgi:hypothetical protein
MYVKPFLTPLRRKFYTESAVGKKIRITLDVTELGRAGGNARAAAMSPQERSEASRKAVQARWAAYYAAHPEKRKTARTGASRKKKGKK